MGSEVEALREEVNLLARKVEILESKENKRKAMTYVKVLVKVILIASLAYGVYRGYDYIVHELPNIIVEKLKDTGKEKVDSFKETISGIFN